MYTEEDIASAIAAGVITEETAAAFRAHVAQNMRGAIVDEEHFRFITGFNDIFVVIASLLLLASIAWIGSTLKPWIGAAGVSIAAWALAEFFARSRRMALPAIVLVLAFVGGVLAVGIFLIEKGSAAYIVASAVAAIAAWLHWLRFRVPITIAAGTAAVIGCVVLILISAVPEVDNWSKAILLTAGVAVFSLAMKWDAADRARQTRQSDVAFWLHLLAAPLLVHPVFSILGVFGGKVTAWQIVAVGVLYFAIAFVSLCIDRRALMVSALTYVLYAFSSLLKQFGLVDLNFAITALFIGSALLLLSAFWHSCRALVLRFVPFAIKNSLAPLR